MAKVSRSIELTNMELLELLCKEYHIKKEGSVMALLIDKGKFKGVKIDYGEENR
ncbi:MAG: hypothetical protein LBE34_13815 [Flavobacteriaceae bacterium]|jgi:hypothetical protein|nr:hypothetical protein [Flavobacteriaceae bacterium]